MEAQGKALALEEALHHDTIEFLINLRQSTPPQERQLNISISNSKRSVDIFWGGVTFSN